jgi:cell division septum initiation protein DivIVA
MTDPTPNRDPGVVPIGPDSSEAHGPRLDELRDALELQREADAMIAEALDTRRAAVVRAETLVREAEQAAARAEEDAAAAASRRIDAAREQADRLLAEAQDQAHQITSDAQTEVTAVRHEAADLRDSAQETIEAAELEWERARRAEEHHEQRLLATQTVAVRMIDNLEQVTATLEDMLERVRGEVASARRDLAQLHGDVASAEAGGPAPSVVLPWPHDQEPPEVADSASRDVGEATETSKHRRFAARNRRGPLRKARL